MRSFEYYRSFFNSYYESFKSDDIVVKTNLQSKSEHTYRVVDNNKLIAKSLNLSEEDTFLSELIALFHDLGRFYQFTNFKTFKDNSSLDHGQLSSELLKQQHILTELNDHQKDIIFKAIYYHNKFELPTDESERVIFFIKLIKDADKLDIFHLLIASYEESERFKNTSFEDYTVSNSYTSEFVTSFLKGENLDYRLAKTTTDLKLMRLSWIYDINFVKSYEIILEKGYVKRLLKFLTHIPEYELLKKQAYSYLHNAINK